MLLKQNKKKNNGLMGKPNSASGFTLIELLVVVSIITFLSSVVLASLSGARMKANDAKIVQDMRQIRNAVELYYADNKTYPVTTSAVAYRENYKKGFSDWLDAFSLSTKKAEADTSTFCTYFTNLATELKSKGYLSSIPVHPYNDTANGVCYKAKGVANSYLAVYAPLSAKLSNGTNKRTGFIVTNSGTVDSVLSTVYTDTTEGARGYPANSSNSSPSSVSDVADEIIGTTKGASVAYGSGGVTFTEPSYTPPTYPLTVYVSGMNSDEATVSVDSNGYPHRSFSGGGPYYVGLYTPGSSISFYVTGDYIPSVWAGTFDGPCANQRYCHSMIGTYPNTVYIIF